MMHHFWLIHYFITYIQSKNKKTIYKKQLIKTLNCWIQKQKLAAHFLY